MAFATVLGQMLVLAFLVIVGFVAHRIGILGEDVDGRLSRLVLDVTLPCMILASVLNAETAFDPRTVLMIFGVAFVSLGIAVALALVAPLAMRCPKLDRGTFAFMVAFGNVGFMGFPVLESVFGPTAVTYGAIHNIPFNLLIFTAGVLMVSSGAGSRDADAQSPAGNLAKTLVKSLRLLVTPTVISCVLAMVLALAGVHGGGLVGTALDTLGKATTPCSLMLIGSSLARYSPREMLVGWRPYVASAVRLLVVPTIVLLAILPLISDPVVRGTLVLLAGMPVATNGLLFCLRYGGNLKAMTQGVFLSTAMSVLTIPCLALLLALV